MDCCGYDIIFSSGWRRVIFQVPDGKPSDFVKNNYYRFYKIFGEPSDDGHDGKIKKKLTAWWFDGYHLGVVQVYKLKITTSSL